MYNPNVTLFGEELEKANFDDALTAEADQRAEYFKRCQVTGEEWLSIPTQIENLSSRIGSKASSFETEARIYQATDGLKDNIREQKRRADNLEKTVKSLRWSQVILCAAVIALAIGQIIIKLHV